MSMTGNMIPWSCPADVPSNQMLLITERGFWYYSVSIKDDGITIAYSDEVPETAVIPWSSLFLFYRYSVDDGITFHRCGKVREEA